MKHNSTENNLTAIAHNVTKSFEWLSTQKFKNINIFIINIVVYIWMTPVNFITLSAA